MEYIHLFLYPYSSWAFFLFHEKCIWIMILDIRLFRLWPIDAINLRILINDFWAINLIQIGKWTHASYKKSACSTNIYNQNQSKFQFFVIMILFEFMKLLIMSQKCRHWFKNNKCLVCFVFFYFIFFWQLDVMYSCTFLK